MGIYREMYLNRNNPILNNSEVCDKKTTLQHCYRVALSDLDFALTDELKRVLTALYTYSGEWLS